MVWVEQPVGTGFTLGKVAAKSETDIANEFLGFFKNFVDTFDLQGKKVRQQARKAASCILYLLQSL